MRESTQSVTSSPSFEDREPRIREANMDTNLFKETFLSPSSPTTGDSDDDKSEALLEKEADMAVYSNHQSPVQSNGRPPPLKLQTVQSQDDIALQSDRVQVQRIASKPQQVPPHPTEPSEKPPKPKGLKALLYCCFCINGDLSEDEEEEAESKEYKMETYTHYPPEEPAMGRFGSLFRKSDDKKSDEANENPYAQQSSGDSYSPQPPSASSFQSYNQQQHSQNQSGLPSGPRPGGGYGRTDLSAPPPYNQGPSAYSPSDKKASPNVPSPGYGNDRFGAQSGYGANRYNNDAASVQNHALPPQRQGGYGGLGGDDNPLFSGYSQQPGRDASSVPPQEQFDELRDEYGNRREMTEEEREEAQVQMNKGEIVDTLRDTVSSTKRSRQMLEDAQERMISMNKQLARDAEILNNAEDRLDDSYHQNKLASANLDNLDAANTSIFNLTANSRGKLAERSARKHQATREREIAKQDLRKAEQEANREWEASARTKPAILGARGKKDNSKYVFDDNDGEQEALNDEIDDDIDAMADGTANLKIMAMAMNRELDRQVGQTDRMAEKANKSYDHLNKNRAHMARKYGD
ncbi:hypothetical protein QBC43DRAFT_305590 [Cladorrhinum sp. PSN259]|nr:hypothetical protein QBC43DRAFT_305590 [Cladorrhinum sp. PSN259]